MNKHIESLLLKQLHDKLSAEEQHDLEQWLKASAANREEYASLLRIWEASAPALDRHAFDTAAALTKINERLRTGSTLPAAGTGKADTRRRITPGHRWIAAACLLLCVAGLWYFNIRQHPREKTIFAGEGNRIITFPDSSIIYLRKGSSITYPEALADGQGERVAELKGEAYFDIRHHADRPFRVNTSQVTVEELGTSFVIRQEDTTCQVMVTVGAVKCTARVPSAGTIILAAGQRALLNTTSWDRYLSPDPNFLSWKNHILEFKQSPLDSVLIAVQDLYGTPVVLSPELRGRSGKIRVTARFNAHQQLQDVLDEIRLTTGLGITQSKDTMIFFQK